MKKLKLAVHTRYFNLKKPYGADLRIYHLYSNMCADVKIITQKPFNFKTIKKKIKNLETITSPCLYPFHFLTRLPCCCRFLTLLNQARDSDFIIAEFHPFHSIGLEAFLVSKILGKKFVLDVHDIAGDFLGAFYEKLMYSVADMVIATSKEQAEYIRKHNKNVFVVENGSEVFEVPPCKEKKHKKIVGFLGALTKENGVESLVKAMREVDATLYLVGDGPLLEKLKEYVKENNMENRVIFFGYKPKEEAIEILSCADVLVAPFPKGRQFNTNLPLKIVDYLMMGKPVVASGGKALRSVVEDSSSGVFCEGELSACINRILSLPDKEKKRISKRARSFAIANLSWKNLAQKFYAYLSDSG